VFDFSGDIKFDLLTELFVDSDSDDVTLDLSRDATELTLPNCGEKFNGVLLPPALDLSWAANELAPPNFGEKLKVILLLPDCSAPADSEVVPANIFVNGLLGPVLEKVNLSPVVLLCMLKGSVVSGAALS
jgi:hypothetical protein